jgi:hypothetical protein
MDPRRAPRPEVYLQRNAAEPATRTGRKGRGVHPEDLRLLREIDEAGARGKVFNQRDGQSYEAFELRLRSRHLISLHPEPKRSSRGEGQYLKSGICRLTLEGLEALARFAD